MDYPQWNRAIAEYFVAGLPAGSPVYLSVDEDTLEDIGERSGAPHRGADWTEDFLRAVCESCRHGGFIFRMPVYGTTDDGLPQCVGFLAAMVLAASRMAGEETERGVTAEHNYFTRLREVFGVSTESGGRPPGLNEEPLWLRWNRWLHERGLLPTAELGSGGTKFIHYPLSQALLRAGDKARLDQIFREETRATRLPRYCDANTMGAWFRRRTFYTRHLADLSAEEDPRRFDAVVNALLELYNSIDWTLPPGQRAGRHALTQRRLSAGFYRREDAVTGAVEYLIYPPQPRRGATKELAVEKDHGRRALRLDRSGWYQPLWIEPLAGGASYPLHGDARWAELVVPQPGFWVLVRDPDDPSSSVLASWRAPGVDEAFLLVCEDRFAAQVKQLREENLLEWSGEPVPLDVPNAGWSEYRDCMILSPDWEDVIAECQDLCEALRPKVSASISLSSGLRVPQRWAWLEGYTPEIRVAAFEERARLKITNIATPAEPQFDDEVATRKAVSGLPSFAPGHYLIEAFIREKVAARQSLEIVAWDTLEPAQEIGGSLTTPVGKRSVCGVLIGGRE